VYFYYFYYIIFYRIVLIFNALVSNLLFNWIYLYSKY